MRRLIALIPLAMGLVVAACGGGGNTVSGTTTPSQTVAPAGSNVAAITVDGFPAAFQGAAVNIPYVTVTVCPVGSTSNCQVIDHVEVDTASYGLRIVSSVLNSSLVLQQELNTNGDGGPLVECAIFGDGFTWGSVKMADLHVSGETASNIPMQVIGDPNFPTPPTSCSTMGMGQEEDTVMDFGANGILGVGPFVTDEQTYYSCPGGSCQEVSISDAQQISNPVASFAADNNGVIVELPSVSATGAPSVDGSLVFGIGTRSNNGIGTATVYGVDANTGGIAITYKSQTLNNSVVDSGSNGNFFTDSIPVCSDTSFYCPASTLAESAVITGTNDAVSPTLDFDVADADSLFSTSNVAFDNLAGPNPSGSAFDFGLSFFYGRNIYTAIDGLSTPAGFGPYIAF